MRLSLTYQEEAGWFQAIIASYWSHRSDAHLTYVLWPLKSFSLRFLSRCITATLQETLLGSNSFKHLGRIWLQPEPRDACSTTMSALVLHVFHASVWEEKSNEQEKGETWREDYGLGEKPREWGRPQEQINWDLLVVSLMPAKFLQPGN